MQALGELNGRRTLEGCGKRRGSGSGADIELGQRCYPALGREGNRWSGQDRRGIACVRGVRGSGLMERVGGQSPCAAPVI